MPLVSIIFIFKSLIKKVKEGGRVVNVSSSAGALSKVSTSLGNQFSSPSLTIVI
jgi:NAD(P)-dependent dehydrogenase (short-subunit alcohol dehydrogenase family)